MTGQELTHGEALPLAGAFPVVILIVLPGIVLPGIGLHHIVLPGGG
jgi:hypothetical protein